MHSKKCSYLKSRLNRRLQPLRGNSIFLEGEIVDFSKDGADSDVHKSLKLYVNGLCFGDLKYSANYA